MKNRSVNRLLFAQPYDMGGFPVRQPFPTNEIEQIDPFLLLHHAQVKVPRHIPPKKAGVAPHPHRGFSPVTFIFKGGVHHRDSRGNNQAIYEGGVQWMNAGMGIVHSERPPENIHQMGGRQEIIQLWINTPAKNKMDQPAYYSASQEEIPVYKTLDGLGRMNVVAGNLLGVAGSIPTLSPVNAATLELAKGGQIGIPLPADHNAFVYLLDGIVNVDGYGLAEGFHAVAFNNDGEGINLEAREATRLLLMTGKPLAEKLVTHGPFVMNSETEILEAMRDYQMGKMGVLIED